MKLLILGGTMFLGRHLVDTAKASGHEVTLFHRGQLQDNYKGVEQLTSTHDGDYSALKGRSWDAAIDTAGYVPGQVLSIAKLLADAVEHYTFISSLSVYSDFTMKNIDETAPVHASGNDYLDRYTGESYGGLKLICEQILEEIMPGRVLHARSGLIVGPHDPTDRFTYWPVRVEMGGEVLSPGAPDRPVQFIDARDHAQWLLHMAEARNSGVYNVTGPDHTFTLGQLLEACKTITRSNATFTWVNDNFLLENTVAPLTEMPLWITEDYIGIQAVNIQKALASGLKFRPVEDTIRDTLTWNERRKPGEPQKSGTGLRGGMMQDREALLLRAWKKLNSH